LGLRHRPHLQPDTPIALGGGRSFYSCIYPSNWPFGGELFSAFCMPGWIFRGWATASATALFGPRPCSSFARRSLCPSPCCHLLCRRLRAGAYHIIHNIKRGSSSPLSGRHGRSQKTVLELSQLLRLGMGWAQSNIAPTPQQLRLRPSGGHASEEPGTVATAARRIVATSEGGGHPSRQSRQERLAYNQYSFMLPLEVVGPGGSLSTVLIATPYWRDVSRRVS
jgi:hypothetical protein